MNSTIITKASTSLFTKEVVTKEGGKGKGWLKVEGEDGEWSCQQLKLLDMRGGWFTLSKVQIKMIFFVFSKKNYRADGKQPEARMKSKPGDRQVREVT